MKSQSLFLCVFFFLFFSAVFCRPVLHRPSLRKDETVSVTKEEPQESQEPQEPQESQESQESQEPQESQEQQEQQDEDDVPSSEVDGGYFFHDPSYHLQWHLQNLGEVEGEDLIDLAIVPAWEAGYSGDGVVVGVVDGKLNQYLPDLEDNIDATLSKDFNFGTPETNIPNHAPAIAGLIAAVAENEFCGVGVAFDARLASIRILDGNVSDSEEAAALTWKPDNIDIYSCSWGPEDDGGTLKGPGPETAAALEEAVKTGRKGKGSIYVWAAGNGQQNNDNCNYDGYANSPYTIAVGAINSYGEASSFSEPCAAMLTTAPGGEEDCDDCEREEKKGKGKREERDFVGITTTDSQDCSSEFKGTDYSAPQVAGVVALMLQANPSLTWRDVQHILVSSSRVMSNGELGVNGWQENAAGYRHHDHYGFGLLNASKATFLAKEWQKDTLKTRICFNSGKISVNTTIRENGKIDSSLYKITEEVPFFVEHVRVLFSASHAYWEEISINITSPSGTVSKLAVGHLSKKKPYQNGQYEAWPFMTVKNWGESPTGNWFMTVSDEVGNAQTGQFESWHLQVCGHYTTSAPTPTPPPVYHVNDTEITETHYEDNRSTSDQFGAILWRFLIVICFLGIIIIAVAFFVSPRSFSSWFGGLGTRGPQRDEDGIFDSGDGL